MRDEEVRVGTKARFVSGGAAKTRRVARGAAVLAKAGRKKGK